MNLNKRKSPITKTDCLTGWKIYWMIKKTRFHHLAYPKIGDEQILPPPWGELEGGHD
jgi:hypothetical protein